MSRPLSLARFAQHELRLSWRDTLSMMTAGRPDRERRLLIGVLIFAASLHGVAYMVLHYLVRAGLHPDLPTLVNVTVGILLAGSAMLSQAMETVTRSFYARSDSELILSSPAPAERLFAVRIGAVALSGALMSMLLIGPFINMLVILGGPRWLGAYGVLVSVSLAATALAVLLAAFLFQAIGPKHTRLLAQIVAAVIGAVFVIGLQVAALFSTGTYSRLAFLRSAYVLAHVPSVHSALWWVARAALGDGFCLAAVAAASVALFLAVTAFFAPRFARYVLLASGISHDARERRHASRRFAVRSAASALRRKEQVLLLRDPWLVSQSLLQLLYLLPPALLLLHSFGGSVRASVVLVPVLIMAAGQLAGGLAWLTISGEDAPDLVGSAPVGPSRLLRAKFEAVLECIAVVFLPFAAGLAFISPFEAAIAAAGVLIAAVSSTFIQLWFRSQANRSQFRRRHSSSRIATFAEAFVSIAWAASGAILVGNSPLAVIVILIALGILLGVRSLSPARARA